MKRGCWGYLGYISWMAKLPWLEKKGWVRQAVAGRSQDSGRSSSGWRRQSERRQRVGEAHPANSFPLLTTTNLSSTDAQNTSEKVVNILISQVHSYGKEGWTTGLRRVDSTRIGEWKWISSDQVCSVLTEEGLVIVITLWVWQPAKDRRAGVGEAPKRQQQLSGSRTRPVSGGGCIRGESRFPCPSDMRHSPLGMLKLLHPPFLSSPGPILRPHMLAKAPVFASFSVTNVHICSCIWARQVEAKWLKLWWPEHLLWQPTFPWVEEIER